MTFTAPDHYSYNFKLDISKLPVIQKDKVSGKLGFYGMFFGVLFIILGFFDLVYSFIDSGNSYEFSLPNNLSGNDLKIRRYLFDILLLIFGTIVVVLSVMSFKRYKDIFFDGERIRIVYRSFFGEMHEEEENLFSYLGVLLTVEYYQFGLINKNRYIIELYHKDKNKRVPLYISTNDRDIRKIWEYYAENLRMPALFMTDKGLISRHYTQLDRTLKDMSKKWHLNSLYSCENVPTSIKCHFKENKTIVKANNLFFDIYSILSLCGVFILGSLLGYALCSLDIVIDYMGYIGFSLFMLVCLVIIFASLIFLLSKDVLIVTNNNVILGHNILFLKMNSDYLSKDDIVSVDIGHNPLTDRYYLSVITNNRSFVFGKNMPIEDLRWVRGFIIREVIK